MARIYVGTYHKYNCGSIVGKWLDLEDYSDKDEFHAACLELHADESDPELMFQDWEDIPDGMVSESHIDEKVWDWLDLDEDDRDLLAAYRDCMNVDDASVERARESFRGIYDSERDFAQEWAEETGSIPDNASWPCNCIDWDAATRELMQDFTATRHNGKLYIFRD